MHGSRELGHCQLSYSAEKNLELIINFFYYTKYSFLTAVRRAFLCILGPSCYAKRDFSSLVQCDFLSSFVIPRVLILYHGKSLLCFSCVHFEVCNKIKWITLWAGSTIGNVIKLGGTKICISFLCYVDWRNNDFLKIFKCPQKGICYNNDLIKEDFVWSITMP